MVTKRRGTKLFRLLALAAVVGGVAYLAIAAGRASNDAPVSFRLAKLDRGPVEETVTATGALGAVVTVQVGSQVSGTILKLGADFNSRVTEGQVIAQLDPTRFRANVEQAEAALKSAQAAAARAKVNVKQAKLELDRANELSGKQVIGFAELDAARTRHDQAAAEVAASEAQVAQARAAVGVARVDLERTTIRAPISGTVLQRAVDVGQTVAASLQAPTLFTIAQDLSQMEVRAAVDEADVGKLKEGQEARFAVDAYPGQEFQATIFQIRSQPNIQQNVVTYDAILRVANPDGKLRPGMTATVRVVSQRREGVLRVPNAALRFKPAADLIEASSEGLAAAGPSGGRSGDGRSGAAPGQPPAHQGPMAKKGAAGGGGPGAGRMGGGPGGGDGGDGRGVAGRSSARVYRPNGSKIVVMSFKPGIADDQFTEVLAGALAEGQDVIIDAAGGAQRGAPSANPMRGRGPRFF